MCLEKIKHWFNKSLIAENAELYATLNGLTKEIDNYVSVVENLMRQIRVLTKEKQHFQDQILFLTSNDTGKPDLDVDWSKPAYTGTNANLFYDYESNEIKTNYSKITISKYYRFWNDEFYKRVTYAYARDRPQGIRNQVLWARALIHEDFGITYQHDYDSKGNFTEVWKTMPQIWSDKKDDCEGFSQMLITIMNLIGASSKEVFMLTGYYLNTGHAFVGFIEDNQVYVLEATENCSQPRLMKGSVYRCEGQLSGISNWACSGVPNVKQF